MRLGQRVLGLAAGLLAMPGVAAAQGYDWTIQPDEGFCQATLLRAESDYLIDVLVGPTADGRTLAMIGITSMQLASLNAEQVAEMQLWTTYPQGGLQSPVAGSFSDRNELESGAVAVDLVGGAELVELVEKAGGLVLMWKEDDSNWEQRLLPLNVPGQSGAAGMGALRSCLSNLPKS